MWHCIAVTLPKCRTLCRLAEILISPGFFTVVVLAATVYTTVLTKVYLFAAVASYLLLTPVLDYLLENDRHASEAVSHFSSIISCIIL